MIRKNSSWIVLRIFNASLSLAALIFLGGCTSIQTTARDGNLEEVKRQLAWGVNVNSESLRMHNTALHMSAYKGHVEIVKYLLEKGANPNVRQESGVTPLAFAAIGGHTEVMEILIAHGANPNLSVVMELAARGGHVEAVKILLEHGADINVKVTDGGTALTVAVSRQHVELVKFLLSKGADVNARVYGKTLLWLAYYKDDVTIGRILLQHGANPTMECKGRTLPPSYLEKLHEEGLSE